MELFAPIPSKLLLFGEHSVLMGSPAITIPLRDFSARLKFPEKDITDSGKVSNLQLKKFFGYLYDHQSWFQSHINLNLLEEALSKGLYLESDIPTGYGLGSSASVCVAVYKAFGNGKIENIDSLRLFYSQLESYFHGKSSGLDPLTIHTERPVIVEKGKIDFLPGNNSIIDEHINVYLLDSGIARDTTTMIRVFQKELENVEFRKHFNESYLPILEKIKEKVIVNEKINRELIKELSDQQLQFFRKLIPEPIFDIWNHYFLDHHTCFKLLGAGGGGYFLVFSKEDINSLKGFNLRKVKLF